MSSPIAAGTRPPATREGSGRRIALWAGAMAFALWELVAAVRWVGGAGGLEPAFTGTWSRVRSDWFLLILVTDHLVIAGTVLVWVWLDAGRRGWSAAARLAWTIAYVATGSPALLGYLAERR